MTNAVLASETPQEAARRLSTAPLKNGYKLEALHLYSDKYGNTLYYRIRLKHPNGEKWIRPMHLNANGKYQLGEPPALKDQPKPIYGLTLLHQYPQATVYVVEGESVVDKLNEFFEKQNQSSKYIAVTSGSATSPDKADWSPLYNRSCILWADNDDSGLTYIHEVNDKLKHHECTVKIVDSKGLNLPKGGDFVDWLRVNPTASIDTLLNLPLESAWGDSDATDSQKLVVITLEELLRKELPPRENILAPWLPKAGLCMVFAERGVGKTYFALEVAMAVAYGDSFLSFNAPAPKRVLYIDGEMPANTMQERLAEIEKRKTPNPAMIQPMFITPDLQSGFMPNLSTHEGQLAISDYVRECDLVIIDNISTLCNQGKENEADSWLSMQEWALQQRRFGKSVLFIHHAGKNGQQRGTSKREDTLDTIIKLKHPSNYEASMGACFELDFEKARSIIGDAVMPIRCQLTPDGWDFNPIEASNYQRVVELLQEGYKQKEIAEELELSKSQVSKYVKKARESGDWRG